VQEGITPGVESAGFSGRWLIVLMVLALVFGLGVGLRLFAQQPATDAQLAESPDSSGAAPATLEAQAPVAVGLAQYSAPPESAEEMFSEFVCPCCGQPIGDCGCGMAEERQAFVIEQVSTGSDKLGIYLAYADQYGLDSFASEEVVADLRQYRLDTAPAERPQIVLRLEQVDLGQVSPKDGTVATTILVENTGQMDLVIENLSTSCGCTTAVLINDGQEGPVFGAGVPVEGWSTAIKPGASAELKVYYDASFHPDARGLMVREVYVSSNDPVDGVVKARIELEQVD
jgi:hypothetical protein